MRKIGNGEYFQDIVFVAQCAVNAISSDFALMKEILNYAENRIRLHLNEKVGTDGRW